MSALVENSIPPYPEGTPYLENTSGTYWPNLSADSQQALGAVQQWVNDNNINMNDLCLSTVDQRLTMLRYLRANRFDVKKSIAHMQKNLEWRKQMNVDEIITQRPEDLLGYSMEELTAVFPHWQYGFDKTGRPVVYKQYGKFDTGRIKKLSGGNFDRIIKYHVWEQEACARLCLQQTQATGRLVETGTGIVDVKDMTLWQITRDFLALTRAIADVDQGQYPETLGRIYILNAPSAFPMVFGMVKPWLDPVVAAKIFVLAGPKEYEPVLLDFIGKENLPANYGGDLPPLDVTVHPYARTMTEYDGVPAHLVETMSAVSLETASTRTNASNCGGDNGDGSVLTDQQAHRLQEMVDSTPSAAPEKAAGDVPAAVNE